MPLADGQTFAGFTILRHLGSGGMGEIYLAQHPRLPRQDALKVLPTAVSDDEEYRIRFIREADIAATLWHPHIVGVHDRGDFDGQLWISMDYVEGTDAARLLSERHPNGMPPADMITIISAVASALDYAHQRQLLHRDVKPPNILVAHPSTENERILLADFGIARWVDDATGLTGTNMTVGTVAYAAPEQLMGETLDGRADQYALAATAFHLLTGQPVFAHSNPAVVISQHLSSEPPTIASRRPDLAELGPVFSKGLAKARDDRYDTCTDFANALAQRLGTVAEDATDATRAAQPVSGPKHRPPPKPSRPSSTRMPRLRAGILVPIVLVLLLVAVSAIAVELLGRNNQPTTAESSVLPRPLVYLGADCAPLGAAGQSATDGRSATCSQIGGVALWSVTSGNLPTPTATRAATDEPLPPDVETQVRECVQESQQTWVKCREDIRRENLSGPA